MRFGGKATLKMDESGQLLQAYLTHGGQSDMTAQDSLHPVPGEFDSTGSSMVPARRQRLPWYTQDQLVAMRGSLLQHAEAVRQEERTRTAAIRIQSAARMWLARALADRTRRLRELYPTAGQLGDLSLYEEEDVQAVIKTKPAAAWTCAGLFGCLRQAATAAGRRAVRRQNEMRHLMRARRRWIRDMVFRRNLAVSASVPARDIERVLQSRQRLEAMERADEMTEWHQLAESYTRVDVGSAPAAAPPANSAPSDR